MPSALEAVVKNAEEIAVQENEEIIEEAIVEEIHEQIEVEQVEWMGPTEVMEQGQEYYQTDDLLEHQIVDYEDAEPYQSFLPIRDGAPFFSMNLPDLMSKCYQITQDSGAIVRLTLCFNKKCQRQVACSGYLYTIKDYLSDTSWNNWRCINDQCFGEIRTTPDFRDIREVHGHVDACSPPDHVQISIRIAVYDARLLSEFTETPLENLYLAAVEKLKGDCPDAFILFPTFEIIKSTLEDHRLNKIYRKRFEMQNLRDKQRKLNMTPDEVVYAENASGLVKFRRTKPFPPSLCNECNDQVASTNLPSQDQLIAHYVFNHGRALTIERFEFKDVNLFDQYIRELNTNSRYRFKRMGLADENMYYLCTHDDRLAKNGIGRASRLQQQNCHCTAFIRVFDWRIVSKREGSRITIDYCLEHQPHPYELDPHFIHRKSSSTFAVPNHKEFVDYYTPEVFLRDLEERRQRSQKMIDVSIGNSERPSKRPLEVKNYIPPGKIKAIFGTRAMAPPLAAQLAAGNTQPYVDAYTEESAVANRQSRKYRQSIRTAYPKSPEEQLHREPTPGSSRPQEPEDPSLPPPRIYISQKPYSRLTERQNFKDIYTFNAVCKVEDACLSLLNRLQSCQNARIGLSYREKIATILRHASTDPGLMDGTSPEDIEKSWVLQRPLRGRPRKRVKLEEGGDEGEEEDDDVEIEYGHEEVVIEEAMEEVLVEDGRESQQTEQVEEATLEPRKGHVVQKAAVIHVAQDTRKGQERQEKEEKSTSLISSSPISSKPPALVSEKGPRVTRATSSSSTSSSAQVGADITRSGRARKPPARLLAD